LYYETAVFDYKYKELTTVKPDMATTRTRISVPRIKMNPAIALTLVLLTLMGAAGIVSGVWGFALGHEALKGVSQPDARPTAKNNAGQDGSTLDSKPLVVLKEADILKNVKSAIDGKEKDDKDDKDKDQAKDQASKEDGAQLVSAPKPAETPAEPGFPIVSQDRGIVLEVRSARQQGGSLVLDVSLKNQSPGAVQFLYSFLDVTDNQGRALSASTEGLPTELPPNNEAVSGTVTIPTAVLDGVDRLSLTLTDYPNQQLRLQASGIPIKPED
jgi:hypothetical protein